MSRLLVSFCRVIPKGLVLATYDFDSEEFEWVELPEIEQGIEGATGICSGNGSYYILLQHRSIGAKSSLVVLDGELNVRKIFPLQKVRDGHSMIFHNGSLWIASSGTNQVIRVLLDDKNNMIYEEGFWTYERSDLDVVHLNSLAQLHGHLYVSMFGVKSGEDWFDRQAGQIMNITTARVSCRDLFHPHSLRGIDGKLYFVESRRGRAVVLNEKNGSCEMTLLCELSGYLRGLAHDGRHLYIGASALRRRSYTTGALITPPGSTPEAMRCYIGRLDLESGEIVKRDLTPFGRQIYDIELLPQSSARAPRRTREEALIRRLQQYDEQGFKLMLEFEQTTNTFQTEIASYRTYLRHLIESERRYACALEMLISLLKDFPRHAEWNYLAAFCLHMQHKDLERALGYYNLALEDGFEEFWVRYNRGTLRIELGDIKGARADLERALELNPEYLGLQELVHGLLAPPLSEPRPELADLQAQLAEKDKLILSLRQEISQFTNRLQDLEAQLVEREISATLLKQQLASVYNSRRWQLATRLAEGYEKIRQLFDSTKLKKDRR